MAQVARGSEEARPLSGLEIDVKTVVAVGKGDGFPAATHAHLREVLRPPGHQVLAQRSPEARSVAAHAKEQCIGAVAVDDKGIEHLARSPWPILRAAELSQVLPRLMVVEAGHVQSGLGIGRIEKHLYGGVARVDAQRWLDVLRQGGQAPGGESQYGKEELVHSFGYCRGKVTKKGPNAQSLIGICGLKDYIPKKKLFATLKCAIF